MVLLHLFMIFRSDALIHIAAGWMAGGRSFGLGLTEYLRSLGCWGADAAAAKCVYKRLSKFMIIIKCRIKQMFYSDYREPEPTI